MGPHTANNRSRNPTPNYHLPVELVTFILQLLFPGTNASYRSGGDMAELYGLRLVSKSWKELVENTPTLWTCVTAPDYPIPVIRDCLRRSKTHPLRITIFHFPALGDSLEKLTPYLLLLQPHSSRWKSVSCRVWGGPGPEDEHVRNFLESPAPILQSISATFTSQLLVPTINLAGGQAKNLKHLDLQSIVLPWSSSLLSGLETFCLRVQDTIPVEEIINLFVKSPGLRRFELSCQGTEGQNNQTAPIAPALDTIAHSLEEAGIYTLPHIASQILSRVSMPRCKSLTLSTNFSWDDGIDSLGDALAQFMPKIGDALSLGGRTTLTFVGGFEYKWSSSSKCDAFDFFLQISGVELEILIEWIRNLATASGSRLELEVTLKTSDLGPAQRLSEWNEITKLTITSECSEFISDEEDEITALLDFLGNPKVDPIDGLSWSWSFPNLQELDLRPSGYGPMKVFNMFSRRYLPDTYVQAMEGSSLAIEPPPKLDVWVECPIEPAGVATMTALENHWGVKSLNRAEGADEGLENLE